MQFEVITISLRSYSSFATLTQYAVPKASGQMYFGIVTWASSMEQEKERYHAYMLRLWQVKDQGQLVWRVSLDNAHTNERLGFGGLDELFEYLRQLAGELPDAPDTAEKKHD